MNDKQPQTVGRYEILELIGSGSQGTVFKARDPRLDRLVAVKVIRDADGELHSKADDGTPLEARVSGRLRHPHIVPIFDAGESDDGIYLVFEYVQGVPIAKQLRHHGGMGIEAAVPVMQAILDAIAHAHEAQVVHLDLNPRNILIDSSDTPRVMDFGLAQYVDFTRRSGDMVSGTLRYMAPELFKRGMPGPWTDVFALGCTFFELVTGNNAFDGEGVREIQQKIVTGKVDMSALRALPRGDSLARFLDGALEGDLKGRYVNGTAMRDAFRLFRQECGLDGDNGAGNHSTVEFLLRRMQRKKDFPGISRTLSDINRLTGDDSTASADKLANVILRDFALTSKLLQLVNSAFYGSRAAQVTSISQAVVFLGLEQVRMTANSLSFFGHMRGDSDDLRDTMTRSFLSGLIARHLAQKLRLPAVEEAFICGMCQNLGESLAIYYFPEEAADVNNLMVERGLEKLAASRGVLGVSYADLGAAVARIWNLPQSIVVAIRGVPAGPIAAPLDDAGRLRDVAVFANELCDCLQQESAEATDLAVDELLSRYAASVGIDREYCDKLTIAAFEKLRTYAPVFEINVATSRYCRAVQQWLDARVVAS